MSTSIDPRGLSPGMIKAARWFSRILWVFMILAVVAAIGYGNDKNTELEELRKKHDELKDENKALKQEVKTLKAE